MTSLEPPSTAPLTPLTPTNGTLPPVDGPVPPSDPSPFDPALMHAYLTALLSLVSSSPAALRYAPYTEPFCAWMSFQGMLYCTRGRWLFASLCFAGASIFRSNGIALCGFIGWGVAVEPF